MQLVKRYGRQPHEVTAVDEVSCDFRASELTVLMGPSGCGKTTLLNLVAGLVSPTSGSVSVAGVELASLKESERTSLRGDRLGMVFQDNALIPQFTVLENVMLPLEARRIPAAAARDEAFARLDRVGISDLADRFLHQISGGQAQRVGIARALTGNRRILLADEPTGALDTKNSHLLFEMLRGLARDGCCVILCSHDQDCVAYADRVLTMRDGAISQLS